MEIIKGDINCAHYFNDGSGWESGKCTQVRKKNQAELDTDEQEKHPENYVAECDPTDLLQETSFGLRCADCGEDKCDYSKPGGAVLRKPTYRIKTECERGNPDWIEETHCFNHGCSNTSLNQCVEICVSDNLTICREKTEAEKLMGRDCDLIFDQILRHSHYCTEKRITPFNKGKINYCNNLKEAWRQKGCTI